MYNELVIKPRYHLICEFFETSNTLSNLWYLWYILQSDSYFYPAIFVRFCISISTYNIFYHQVLGLVIFNISFEYFVEHYEPSLLLFSNNALYCLLLLLLFCYLHNQDLQASLQLGKEIIAMVKMMHNMSSLILIYNKNCRYR